MSSPKYRAIMCDPPWGFSNTSTRGSALSHYAVMTQQEIIDFTSINKLAQDDCVMFLWVPNSFVHVGIQALQNWGWCFILPIPWVKMNNGKIQIGLGNYFRNCTEILLFGMRGKVKPLMRNIPNVIIAPRTRHSQKPELAYSMVERYTEGPYLDMFARYHRPGWHVWGNEIDEDIHYDMNHETWSYA